MDWTALTRGQRVKIAGEMKGMTVGDIARRANRSRFTLSHVVNGKLPGHVDLWVDLAHALGVRLGWLLEGEGEVWQAKTPLETTKAAEAIAAPAARPPRLPLNPVSARTRQRKS